MPQILPIKLNLYWTWNIPLTIKKDLKLIYIDIMLNIQNPTNSNDVITTYWILIGLLLHLNM